MKRAIEDRDTKVALVDISNLILQLYREGKVLDKKLIDFVKRFVGKKYGLKKLPRDYEILEMLLRMAPKDMHKKIISVLRNKPVRSISGVAVVAVMTKPLPCPGKCIYCPGGVKNSQPTPQSYTGHEPAARRAAQLDYDPFNQVVYRLRQFESIGHNPVKVELIIMGGTFLFAPREYKEWFIRGIYEGLLGQRYPNKSLKKLQELLEHSKYRLVGLTVETRPDFCLERHVDEMLSYGATRVEIGVQSLDDEVLENVKRGHSVKDVIKAFRVAKDAGLKIVAHMMLNLPPAVPELDVKSFEMLFNDPDFRPDMIKIYPTAIIKGTVLYKMWKRGEYTPYSEDKLIEVIAKIKKMIPPWIRVQRVQRDIPLYMVDGGYKIGNLRQIVHEYMRARGWRCRCIRCREIGLNYLKYKIQPDDVKLIVRKYEASQGEEIFISFEDIKKDLIIGFLRLRRPSDHAHRPEISKNTMIVRELHVYGELLPIGEKSDVSWQHRGFGKKLLRTAERIATEEYDARKIVIISGIGVREYYRKFGYQLEGPYMSKKLR